MGRITMDDVLREVDICKGNLCRAVIRLNQTHRQIREAVSTEQRRLQLIADDPQVAAMFGAYVFSLRDGLSQYKQRAKDVAECVAALRMLRVPESEIQSLLKE